MNAKEAIPFLDLVTPHVELEQELSEVFNRALRTASFIGGPLVEQFERGFAHFCGVKYCVGASNGTDALRFALTAAGVKAGDVAITVANTFIATVEAIVQTGARPAFVDVDPITGNMSVPALKRYLVSGDFASAYGPRVILPVHLYGLPAPITESC